MKKLLLRFGLYENVTLSGMDGTVIRFPFTMIEGGLIGSPEEFKKTTSHLLEVTITRTVRDIWKLNEFELMLILFEIGRREIVERLRQQRHLSMLEKVNALQGNGCPFDPKRIRQPEGYIESVEIHTKIGF